MNTIIFDFSEIQTKKDFFKKAKIELNLPNEFGNNLDALYDVLTGFINLPVEIIFEELTLEQLEIFENIITLFEDVENELDNQFIFHYFMIKED